MVIARRQFLQALSAVCGTQILGIATRAESAELHFISTLSSSSRKLAVLVGINQYNTNGDWLSLHGCLTDVELERELLIHRFGFLPQDIVTITDQQATRAEIATAIREHLVSQAIDGDVVFFHFSGHGARLSNRVSNLLNLSNGESTLVAIDGEIPISTLNQWLGACVTPKILGVLDTGASYPGSPIVGNLRIRAKPPTADPTLIAPTPTKPQPLTVPQILRAAEGEQICADMVWNGFSSGLFTYLLTQQLWQSTPSSLTAIPKKVKEIATADRQTVAGNSTVDLAVDLTPVQGESADGVITEITADRRSAEVWLGGLPTLPLSYYGVGSALTISATGEVVQIKSRSGLTAKVEATSSGPRLQPGQLLQEQIRAVPKQLHLAIALDLGLNRIERVDATSTISTLPRMIGVPAGETQADCVFGNQNASYGLFSVNKEPLLGSFGSVGESVGAALRRLQPLLEGLLAAKFLKLTSNQDSSRLAVKATLSARMGVDNYLQVLANRCTERSLSADRKIAPAPTAHNKSLAIGDRLSFHIENLMEIPLYVTVFCVDARGRILIPSFVRSPYASDAIVLPRQILTIPQPQTPFTWSASAPQGLVNVQVVLSRAPFAHTAAVLSTSLQQSATSTGIITPANPLKIIRALLQDLDQNEGNNEFWLLNVDNWATLDFNYRVA
jgi:hypothetical protein